MPRARSDASTFSRLWRSKRRSSWSSRAKALTTRIEEKTSSTIEASSLSVRRTSREAVLIRRVNAYTTRKRTGAMDRAIRVKRQFTYSITPMIPTRVRALVRMPKSAKVMKS
jgi:transposase